MTTNIDVCAADASTDSYREASNDMSRRQFLLQHSAQQQQCSLQQTQLAQMKLATLQQELQSARQTAALESHASGSRLAQYSSLLSTGMVDAAMQKGIMDAVKLQLAAMDETPQPISEPAEVTAAYSAVESTIQEAEASLRAAAAKPLYEPPRWAPSQPSISNAASIAKEQSPAADEQAASSPPVPPKSSRQPRANPAVSPSGRLDMDDVLSTQSGESSEDDAEAPSSPKCFNTLSACTC